MVSVVRTRFQHSSALNRCIPSPKYSMRADIARVSDAKLVQFIIRQVDGNLNRFRNQFNTFSPHSA